MTDTITLSEIANQNKDKLNANRDEFQRVFGIPLHRFFHPFWGFDVIKFDEWLKTPDGTSTADYIKQTKGQNALTLVEELL